MVTGSRCKTARHMVVRFTSAFRLVVEVRTALVAALGRAFGIATDTSARRLRQRFTGRQFHNCETRETA